MSVLRRLVWLGPVLLLASACQPAGDRDDDAATPPVTDAAPSDDSGPIDLTPSPDADATDTADTDLAPSPVPRPEPEPEPDVQPVALDLNDVSILLPPPTSPDDPVLAITDLAFNGASVWPDAVFAQFLTIANSEAGAVAAEDDPISPRGARIDISAFTDKSVWHVAGIRIDPGAPGLAPNIGQEFGQTPQIRLVLQPVTAGARVHDVAAHVIYSFAASAERDPNCALPRFQPDQTRFRQIVDGLVAMKTALAEGEIGGAAIDTGGPLGVHPAAANDVTRTAFRDSLKAFLDAHLDPSKLRAMAIMGLPRGAPEPWIFLAMAPNPQTGQFAPVPSPALAQDRLRFAQMLDARDEVAVAPAVRANNLSPITCSFELPSDPSRTDGPASPATASGVSTAELFPTASAARMREVVEVIADPTRAHFFNTDCVSCHTETRREMDILGTDSVDAPVDPDVLPTELWNVRNFGWFPSFLERGVLRATATRRTAAETEEVLEAINADLATR